MNAEALTFHAASTMRDVKAGEARIIRRPPEGSGGIVAALSGCFGCPSERRPPSFVVRVGMKHARAMMEEPGGQKEGQEGDKDEGRPAGVDPHPSRRPGSLTRV